MTDRLIKLKAKISVDFIRKIEKYKKNNRLSYGEIARIAGINKFYFANLRSKIKKGKSFVGEETLKKFEKAKII